MKTARDLLTTKGREVHAVAPDATVYDALALMAEKGVGAVIVLEGGRLVGILSERDYARGVILQGRTSRNMTVAELMSSPVLTVRLEQTIEDCMALMTARHVRHLPVVEREALLGIVTIGDVVKQIISEQEHLIRELENYIRGA